MRSRVLALVRQQPIALLALFVALGGTSFAATRSGGDASADVIHGCVGKNTGRLRIVDSPIRCGTLETPIAFNKEGRRGPQGPRGEHGAKGDTGDTGAAGAKGDAGAAGAKGDTGTAGAKGDTGSAGADGAPGAKGDTGTAGADGAKGDTGTPGQSVTVATETAGGNCATGGVKLTSASGTNYVCDGVTETASSLLTKLLTVDGQGSGLDADTVDGVHASSLVSNGTFGSLFDSRLSQKFFSGTVSETANSSGGSNGADWLGQVYLTAANFPPPGTAIAAGQILAISQNTALFSLLGTTYGGNGTTTFALPDLRGEAPNGTNYVIALEGLYPSH